MTEYQDSGGRLFQKMDAATGNERRPTVARDTPEPAAGVMRMSADDDDQADKQHELADPGMAETDHSVLETPCQRSVWHQLALASCKFHS